jgi:hypothetical protein
MSIQSVEQGSAVEDVENGVIVKSREQDDGDAQGCQCACRCGLVDIRGDVATEYFNSLKG